MLNVFLGQKQIISGNKYTLIPEFSVIPYITEDFPLLSVFAKRCIYVTSMQQYCYEMEIYNHFSIFEI